MGFLKMRSKAKRLVIVAHPDDEIIFFAQVIIPEAHETHVILVTNGNGDGQSHKRISDFKNVMKKCSVESYETWNFEDNFDNPINEELFTKKLNQTLQDFTAITEVYTHGPFGEYAHPHHIQISKLVHENITLKGLSVYHPDVLGLESDKQLVLSDSHWAMAADIMAKDYESEYQRFFALLPIRKSRAFILDKNFVGEIIKQITEPENNSSTDKKKIGPYGPYRNLFKFYRSKKQRDF